MIMSYYASWNQPLSTNIVKLAVKHHSHISSLLSLFCWTDLESITRDRKLDCSSSAKPPVIVETGGSLANGDVVSIGSTTISTFISRSASWWPYRLLVPLLFFLVGGGLSSILASFFFFVVRDRALVWETGIVPNLLANMLPGFSLHTWLS